MKLIYLYFDGPGLLSGKQFNFDAEYRCYLKGDRLTIARNSNYVQGFFSLDPEANDSQITCSAIIGENGTGKTSIAAVLYHIFARTNYLDRYILVYERRGKVCVCQKEFPGLGLVFDGDVNYCGGLPFCGSDIPFGVKTLYYSPMYTSQRVVESNGDEFTDISTSGLLEELPEKFGNVSNPASYHILQTGALNARDLLWTMEFLSDYHSKKMPSSQLTKEIEMAFPLQCLIICNERSMGPVIDEVRKWEVDERSADSLVSAFRLDEVTDSFVKIFLCYAGNYLRAVNMSTIPVADEYTYATRLMRFVIALHKRICTECEKLVSDTDYRSHICDFLGSTVRMLDKLSGYTIANVANTARAAYNFFTFIDQLSKRRQKQGGDAQTYIVNLLDKEQRETFLHAIKEYVKSRLITDYVVLTLAPRISSGEMAFFTMWGRLHNYIEDDSDCILFMDEAETSMHPRWQRMLVYYMVWYFTNFKPDVRVHIIFASHSPMLLSDMPSKNVIMLQDAVDGNNLNFASSISDLYLNSYNLKDGPYGLLAQKKLEALFGKKNKNGFKSFEGRDALIADEIGDEMIRNYLRSNR